MLCRHKKLQFAIEIDEQRILRCKECGLLISEKRFQKIDPVEIYDDYYKNEVNFGRFKFGVEYIVRMFRLFRAFKIFTIIPRGNKILDIGSGTGFLLYYLKKYFGYQRAVGTQLAGNAYNFSKKVLGLEVYQRDLLDLNLPANSFDVVCMWHVLEHVQRPEQYLSKIKHILVKDGVLVIEVPNLNSWSQTIAKGRWLGWDVKYHLTFYTSQTLIQQLNELDYEVKLLRTFSMEYSTFISAQSIISWMTNTDQLFFNWIQGVKIKGSVILHTVLMFFLFPICFLINIMLMHSDKGEILLIVARKK